MMTALQQPIHRFRDKKIGEKTSVPSAESPETHSGGGSMEWGTTFKVSE